jgi:hypothetical protein
VIASKTWNVQTYVKLVNESPLDKYLNVTANIIVGSIVARYFVSIRQIFGPVSCSKILKSRVNILKKSLNSATSFSLSYVTSLSPYRILSFSHFLTHQCRETKWLNCMVTCF